MERRIVAQLLTSMDELSFEKTGGKPVIVIGATNRPDSLDAALRRAGRFDREICLNVPNEISRLHILKKMSSNLKIDGSIDYSKLAKLAYSWVCWSRSQSSEHCSGYMRHQANFSDLQ